MDTIRIKGKITRKDGATKLVQVHLPIDLANKLDEKYDYDSISSLFTAIVLDNLGELNLKKEKIVNIEEILSKKP